MAKGVSTGPSGKGEYRCFFSDMVEVKQGVPQRAVLSPCLFNIMLSDFPLANEVQVIGYADDITLISASTDVEIARYNMQLYIRKIENWTKNGGLS